MNGNAGSLDQVLGHLRSSADDTRRRGELIEGAISQAIGDFARLREQIAQAQNQNDLLQASVNELKEAHSRSLARNSQLESFVEQTQEQRSQSQAQLQSAQKRIHLLEQEIRNLRHRLFHAHQELETQKKSQIEEALSSKKAISELNNRLAMANESIEGLRQDRQSLNQANLEAQIQISSLQREQQRLQVEKAEKTNELKAMKKYSEELRGYIDTCMSRYQDHSRSMHQIVLQAQDALAQERKARAEDAARYQEQVYQFRRELDQIPRLQDQLGSLSEENERLSQNQPIQALLSLKQKQIESIRAKIGEDSVNPSALAQAKKLLMNLEEQKQVLLALLGKSSTTQDFVKRPVGRNSSLVSNDIVN